MSAAILAQILQTLEVLLKDPYNKTKYGSVITSVLETARSSEKILDSPASPDPEPLFDTDDLSPSVPLCTKPPLSDKDNNKAPKPIVRAPAQSVIAPHSNAGPRPSTPPSPPTPPPLSPESPATSPSHPAPADVEMVDAVFSDVESEGQSSDSNSSASSSNSDEFITVVGKGKKRARKAKSKAPVPSKKVAAPSAATSSAPSAASPSRDSRPPTPPPAAKTAPRSKPAVSAASGPQSERVPPPLYIHDKGLWTAISKVCVEKRINFTSAQSLAVGIKVQVPTSKDYRDLSAYLRTAKVQFHTYSLKEDRPFRIVLRNVPKEIPTEDILCDLQSQKIAVTAVHRLYQGRGGAPYNIVLAICENSPAGRAICQLKSVCHLTGIILEKPYKSGLQGQCHNCQYYGHSQSNCFARPRCVKCLGDHGTKDCSRPKDHTLCTEDPSCVLCGQQGHPANYRGCPKAPRPNHKATKRTGGPLKVPSSDLPKSLRPQRESPWNALNHQQSFPALKPKNPPSPTAVAPQPLMATPVPAPLPMPASQQARAPQPKPVHTSASQPSGLTGSVFGPLSRLFNPVIMARSRELLARLKLAQGNAPAVLDLMSEYADVAEFCENFRVDP